MAMTERGHRRTELLSAAARLFRERGYNGTSMQHLGEAVGLLRGSLYAHISSKEDLLFDIVDRGADRFITRLEEVVASDRPPEQKVRDAMAAHIESVAEHLDASTVFMNDWRFLGGERREIILAKRDLYESLWQEIVEEGIEWEVFRQDLDPKFATLLLLSACNWLYQWYDTDGDLAPGDIADRFADMMMGGMKA